MGSRLMHRIIIALLLFSSGAAAGERQEWCNHMQQVARAAMTARQAGIPLQTMLQLVGDETAIGIFKESYRHPKHESAADQKSEIASFGELVLTACLKA